MASKRTLALTLGLALALAGMAAAQGAVGNVYGTAEDASGAVLPGVNVTLEGETGTRTTVSGADGAFRFLNVAKGDYTLTLSMTGFATVTRPVRVTVGENIDLTFSMKVSSVQETIEVMAETPLVNVKKRGTSTTMTSTELQEVPNARDPWAVLKAVPGVVVDRVNIAGNQNGQQANFAGKGDDGDNAMWMLDGVVVTDMSAVGASPTYFDFGAFEEIGVTTSGNDLQMATAGIGLNLTTKRGTNRFHGSGRFFWTDESMSFSNLPSSLNNDPRLENEDGTRRDQGDHINVIKDYGFDLGGPILKDSLWFYFSYGKQDIQTTRLTGTPDDTLLPGYNAKLNWQAGNNTMVSAFWFEGKKQKFGRSIGFQGESESFLWDQGGLNTEGGLPSGFWKLQVDHTFSPDFFMSVKGAYYDTGFGLTPNGGLGQSWTIDYFRGEAIGSFAQYGAIRPQVNITVDGNYFFEGLGGSNELKFGMMWRDVKTTSGYALGGNQLVGYTETATGGYAEIGRSDLSKAYKGQYTSFWLGDVLTMDRLTVNFGVRYDIQKAKNLQATVPANATFPELLPALEYPGDPGWRMDWGNWSPRIGFSYALNDSRRTVLRGSYATYSGQLPFGDVDSINPIGWGAFAYGWNDTNGDRFVQAPEIDLNDPLYSYGINLDDPSSATSNNRIDQNYKASRDHDFSIGLDHELSDGFAVGVAYSYRRSNNFGYAPRMGAACDMENATVSSCGVIVPGQYSANAPETALGYTAFTYSPDPALVSAGGSGRITTNAPGYKRTFSGLEFTLIKRLSNRWMTRVAVTLNDWKETWDGTPYSLVNDDGNPTSTEDDQTIDGEQVSLLSGASGTQSFFTNVRWQIYANGLYQGPWGLDFSGAIFARQGGPLPISLRLRAGSDGTNPALATATHDELRLDTLANLDLRLAKTIRFGGTAGLTLSAEWFNVFNSGTVLNRYRYANQAAFLDVDGGAEPANGIGRIEEILSPSIFRLGARLSF
jgi:hypothetical protein